MADRKDFDRGDAPTPARGAREVPATPGFHEAPGRQAPSKPHSTIPATPGFHEAPRTPARGVAKSHETAPTAPTPRQRPARGSHAAGPVPPAGPAGVAASRPRVSPAHAATPAQGTPRPSRPSPDARTTGSHPKTAPAKPARRVEPNRHEPKPQPVKPAPKLETIEREAAVPKVPAYRPPQGMAEPVRESVADKMKSAGVAAGGDAEVSTRTREEVTPAPAPNKANRHEEAAPGVPEPTGPRVDDETERRADAKAATKDGEGTKAEAKKTEGKEPEGREGEAGSSNKRAARSESAKRPSIGELFSKLSDQIQTLVTGEIALAKAKATGLVRKIGVGAGLLIAAAVLALYLLGVLLHAAVLGLSVVLQPWAAALVVAAILLVIILILALVGVAQVKKGLNSTPKPQEGLRKDIDAVKKGMGK